MLQEVAKTTIAGAAIGGMFGLCSYFVRQQPSSSETLQVGENAYTRLINLKYEPEIEGLLHEITDYRTLNPEAYQALRTNLDRIIGLQIVVMSSEPALLSYELKASRYQTNIEFALKALRNKFHNRQPSKRFADSEEALIKSVEDIVHNIGLEMREKITRGEFKVENNK